MSLTVLRQGSLRFYFFSREEARMHIHIQSPDGEAKFWLEPDVRLATSTGLSRRQLKAMLSLVEEHANEFRNAWRKHFAG